MHAEGFFEQAFVYLLAAVVAVPVAKRLGLGSVLGYLLAGVAIGPFGLGLVGQEGQDVMHFAEFGVVMMLFLVGLELEPTLLWRLRVDFHESSPVSRTRHIWMLVGRYNRGSAKRMRKFAATHTGISAPPAAEDNHVARMTPEARCAPFVASQIATSNHG